MRSAGRMPDRQTREIRVQRLGWMWMCGGRERGVDKGRGRGKAALLTVSLGRYPYLASQLYTYVVSN